LNPSELDSREEPPWPPSAIQILPKILPSACGAGRASAGAARRAAADDAGRAVLLHRHGALVGAHLDHQSHTFPAHDFVGLAQYERLFNSERWIVSLENMVLFGACS